MSNASQDTERSTAAMMALIDGRSPSDDMAEIMVTLEHMVASTLLAVMDRNTRNAAAMLNEGLVPGVERRIALFEARTKGAYK